MTKIRKRSLGVITAFLLLFFFQSASGYAQESRPVKVDYDDIITGAARFDIYLPILENRKIGIVANQSSRVGNAHLVDTLMTLGLDVVKVVKIFSPEHGFRGEAEAGAIIDDGRDPTTGIRIISLYGKHKKPTTDDLNDIDIMLFDLQDVGVRFYTYISTLTLVMEACAEAGIPVLVLDRPNPNGFSIDGPMLDTAFASFVGMHPVPVLYGMTIGEYARMVNGEKWLENGIQCDLQVIPLDGYDHGKMFELPVRPSPNLPNWQSVYLYPSLCFFEGTVVSVGRGTPFPFQVYGHPDFTIGSFFFTPRSTPGASLHPKLEDVGCYGQNLTGYAENYRRNEKQLSLTWLIAAYEVLSEKHDFFTDYFNLLAGNDVLKKQIESGLSGQEIRESWKNGHADFLEIRKKYLLYD